jgi:serine/threonine-protein kinase
LRTDIYALGVILYEGASGRVPFDADNFMGILTQHMYKSPVPIRALVPPQDVPPGLEAIVLKALSKKPEQRYQTMEELTDDLEKLRRGAVPDAVPQMMSRSGGFNVPADFFLDRGMPVPVPATPLAGARRRWGVYAGVAGVLAAVAIVVGIFAKSASSTASGPPPKAVAGEGLARVPTAAPPSPSMAPGPAAVPVPPEATNPTSAPVAAGPEMRRVLFASEPLDSHVFQNGRDLGPQPLTVDIPAGGKVTVEVRRDGYRPQTLSLDGSEAKVKIRLSRVAGGRSPGQRPAAGPDAKPAAAPASPPPFGGGDIVNPWAK